MTTQTQTTVDRAVEAVRAYYGTKPDLPDHAEDEGSLETHAHHAREDIARRYVTQAVKDGTTAAQIAAAVGVRQLLVATLIDDTRLRAEALTMARRDAERYLEDVREAARSLAVRAIGDGASEYYAAEIMGVSRMTIRKWIGKDA